MQKTNNELYFDTTQVPSSFRHQSGTIGFCALFPSASYNNISSSSDLNDRVFLLLSVSEPSGSGIVKFSTLDTTSAAPTLTSIEFEVNMT